MQNRFRLERMDGAKAWQVVTGETMVDGEPRRALSHWSMKGLPERLSILCQGCADSETRWHSREKLCAPARSIPRC